VLQQQAGFTGSILHRKDPGPALQAALRGAHPALRARLLRGAGELGRRDLLPQLRECLTSEDEPCRFWACWSTVLLGDVHAAEGLKTFLVPASPYKERALGLCMRVVPHPEALALQGELARNPVTLRLATQAAGILGDPALMPWIQAQFAEPKVARVAGEAFSLITGVDLAHEDLEIKAPDGFESGPNDDPEDENVDPDADDDLPWPDPRLIQVWWDRHQGRFTGGVRHLLGQTLTQDHLITVLKTGRQRQRVAAALEISLGQPGLPLFNTYNSGSWQPLPFAQPLVPVPTANRNEDWKAAMMRGLEAERRKAKGKA
jgi:uncharacterized protein (TIGR02270 family)